MGLYKLIGMANYEKKVEQEAAYPIPISLYNCYRTVRHEKRAIATPSSLGFSIGMGYAETFFHNLPSLYPLHLEDILVELATPCT